VQGYGGLIGLKSYRPTSCTIDENICKLSFTSFKKELYLVYSLEAAKSCLAVATVTFLFI
jgi:hypothetical protein